MKKQSEVNVINVFKPKMLDSYLYNINLINSLQQELNNTSYTLYLEEEKLYVADFNSKYNCNPHNPCTEYPEFYEGLNEIRKRYNLSEIHPMGCLIEVKNE